MIFIANWKQNWENVNTFQFAILITFKFLRNWLAKISADSFSIKPHWKLLMILSLFNSNVSPGTRSWSTIVLFWKFLKNIAKWNEQKCENLITFQFIIHIYIFKILGKIDWLRKQIHILVQSNYHLVILYPFKKNEKDCIRKATLSCNTCNETF